jgi:hypothetical protein
VKRPYGRKGCTVTGCERKHYALGYCRPHYLRVRKHGTTDSLRRPPEHGTISRYTNRHRCRCPRCRAAWAKYCRERKRAA